MVAKFLVHMRSPLHFFHLLHIAHKLETLMFMSTADCNRSGHVATDTINTFTARKGAGARLGSAERECFIFHSFICVVLERTLGVV